MKGKKTGGRKAGTPNVVTSDLRVDLKHILHQELQNIPDLLEKLTPEQRVTAVIKLAQFVLPKVAAVNFTVDEGPFADLWQ